MFIDLPRILSATNARAFEGLSFDRAQITKEVDTLKKWIGDKNSQKPAIDLVLEALRHFYESADISNLRQAQLVCYGCIEPFGAEKAPLIEDEQRFPRLLDCVERYCPAPRAFRRCYRGLLSGYFHYDPDAPKSSIAGKKNWRKLRSYLHDRADLITCSEVEPYWVDAIARHKNLLTEDPCARYALSLLSGDGQDFDEPKRELDISTASWLVTRLVLAQVDAAVSGSDVAFLGYLSRLLTLLDEYRLVLDSQLAKVLERYRKCEDNPSSNLLRDFAVSHWGIPWLASNSARWGRVSEPVRRMVADWLKLELVQQFFSLLAEDGVNDKRRLRFWERFIESIDDMYFALGSYAGASDQNHCTADAHRRGWGEIRRLALAARAQLDTFLFQTVVLTPERLDIRLAKTEIGDSKVIEIIPGFSSEPDRWLQTFDTLQHVPDRYDIPTSDGIVQVLIIPEVKTVLEQIKRMPGRRVAGSRAEAFVTNPFAALGEDAAHTIDADQFERARAQAGLLFERFTAHVKRDGAGYPIEVGLLIERTDPSGPASSDLRLFTSDEELLAFIKLVRERLSEEMQLCAWDGYDFELLGDTPREVEILEKAHAERRRPRTLVSYADIYDLTRYADRIEIIGEEKPYYSPFIAKRDNDEGWLPENVVPVIAWTPEEGGEPIAVPLTDGLKDQIEAKLAEAKAAGRDELNLNGFDRPLPVREAEFILQTFRRAAEDIRKGEFEPSNATESKTDGLRPRHGLVIHANIKAIDYEETRRDILTALMGEPKLPKTLKPDVELKDHQRAGIAWLQYLFDKTPDYCRGAVLADDMGLGKTLQLLAFIMSIFEERPDLAPALVVAPVALLENWIGEIDRFFIQDTVPRLIAYGDSLAHLRVQRASIDEQLQKHGLVKFLRPGWRGAAKIGVR
jgi:EH_Signature domain/SNF2-related domain